MPASQRQIRSEQTPSAPIEDLKARLRATGQDASSASLQSLVSQQSKWIAGITEAMDCDSVDHAAAHIVSTLHASIASSRVSLSIMGHSRLQLAGDSLHGFQSVTSSESAVLLQAMQEAIDHDAVIVYPGAGAVSAITDAHERLLEGRSNSHLMTVPLVHRERFIGVALFELENAAPWDLATRQFAEQLCMGVAPILALHQYASQGLWAHAKRECRLGLGQLLGASNLTLKFMGITAGLLFAALAVVPMDRSVVAEAMISPTMRHIISAPTSGFIASVNVRAGEVVAENQLLLTLDTRDLKLDVQRKQVEIDRFSAEYRGAMADHNRKAMAIAQAKLDRARAESDLARLELSRAEIRAPMAGYVMGDALSKANGAPIGQGDALIQIAPVSGHEVHVLVDEADILDVRPGSVGSIALKSSPGDPLDFTVDTIRPIAESVDGATRFRVEAKVAQTNTSLRPGQTGFAHIATEQQSALRVMTWRISRWVRERLWILFG